MNFTTICLIVMLLMLKFSSTVNKWWLSFAILITIAALLGYELHIFGLMVAIGFWKVFSDLCRAR